MVYLNHLPTICVASFIALRDSAPFPSRVKLYLKNENNVYVQPYRRYSWNHFCWMAFSSTKSRITSRPGKLLISLIIVRPAGRSRSVGSDQSVADGKPAFSPIWEIVNETVTRADILSNLFETISFLSIVKLFLVLDKIFCVFD
jgi:hypothetical protein